MKNADMIRIATEEVAAAKLNNRIEIRVLHSTGNKIMLRTFVHDKDGSVCQRGWGKNIWGILDEQNVRQAIRSYIGEVNH